MLSQKEWEATIAWSKVVAACVIRREDGKYLLVQEAQSKVYGLWNLAAGHVDKDESIESAAVREAKEETGLDVELVDKIGIWHEEVEGPIRHAFTVKIIGGEVRPQPDEILDVKWFTYDEITKMYSDGKLRVEWIFEAITIVDNQSR
ncbi:MAG: NUDIX hydrolase [Candidatus Saccharimonadales bacterium]